MARKLDWQNNSIGHSGQNIYLKEDDGLSQLIASVGPAIRTYTDSVDRTGVLSLEYSVETVGSDRGVPLAKLGDPVKVLTADKTLRFKVMGGTGAWVSLSTGYGEWSFPGGVATNLTVKWGNGVTTNITSEGYDTYYYPEAIPPEGYIVEVTGATSKALTLSGDALVEVIGYGDLGIRGINHVNATNLVKVPTSIPRSVTHLGIDNYTGVFAGCTKFNDPNVLQWDTSNIANMDYAFHKANAFNQPIGVWDTSNVISMKGVFYENTIFNQPLNNWNMSKVISTHRMFGNTTAFNGLIGQWNVGQATNMYEMFAGASAFNQDLSTWDVSNVTDMSYMFSRCSVFDGNITTWNTGKVTNMQHMFSEASVFNQAIGGWNVSNVTDMSNMFNNAKAFNQPLSTWSTISLVNAAALFAGASAFNQDLSTWDVSNVTDMSYMFNNAKVFNRPLDAWNTTNVTDISGMFYGASTFNQPIGSWDTGKVSNMRHLFRDATIFNQPINQWCVPSITGEPIYFSWNGVLAAENKPVWGTCPVKSVSLWRTTNELKLLTDTGEFRGHFSGFGAPSGHSLFLDMLNNYQETKASFYTYGADQLIGEVDLTEYLSTLKQLIIDYPTGFNAGTNMWYTDIYKTKDVSDMSPQFQILIEAIADHFGVWTGLSTITLQFEGQGGRLASGEFHTLGVLRLHFTMYTLREGESTQYLDIFVESVVTPSNDLTLYSRGRKTTDWGNLLKTAEELEGTSEEVLLKDNGDTSTIVLKELGYIARR